MNMNLPLGLPIGSVRAILSISLVTSTVILFLLKISVPDWYIALVVMAVSFYFAIRQNDSL